MTRRYVMALDEGSTNARAVLVDEGGRIVSEARNPVVPNFPHTGWVELDPVALWQAQRASMEAAMAKAGATTDDIAAMGLTSWCVRAQACSTIRSSAPRSSRGCSKMCQAPGRAPNVENWRPARWIAGSSGTSLAAAAM